MDHVVTVTEVADAPSRYPARRLSVGGYTVYAHVRRASLQLGWQVEVYDHLGDTQRHQVRVVGPREEAEELALLLLASCAREDGVLSRWAPNPTTTVRGC